MEIDSSSVTRIQTDMESLQQEKKENILLKSLSLISGIGSVLKF